MSTTYKSQAARDAKAAGYGTESYWAELDRQAQELHDYFAKKGDTANAERMLTRSLSESLRGNEGT